MIKKLLLRAAFAGTAIALITAVTAIECGGQGAAISPFGGKIDPLAVKSVDIQRIEKKIQDTLPSSKLLQAVHNNGQSPELESIQPLVPGASEQEIGLAVLLMIIDAWDRIFSAKRLAIMNLLLAANVNTQEARQIAFKLAQDYKGHINNLILETTMKAFSSAPPSTLQQRPSAPLPVKIPVNLQAAVYYAEELLELFKQYGFYA